MSAGMENADLLLGLIDTLEAEESRPVTEPAPDTESDTKARLARIAAVCTENAKIKKPRYLDDNEALIAGKLPSDPWEGSTIVSTYGKKEDVSPPDHDEGWTNTGPPEPYDPSPNAAPENDIIPSESGVSDDGKWRDLLQRTSKGLLRTCVENVVVIASHDNRLKGTIAHDCFARKTIKARETPWISSDKTWTDTDSVHFMNWLSRNHDLDFPITMIEMGVNAVASLNDFHPLRRRLESLKWDGKPRVDELFINHFGAEDTKYTRGVASRFLISAVARVFQPGCKVDTVPILEGAQGAGKSTAIRILSLEPEWFSDSPLDVGSKDAFQNLAGKWLFEIAELSSFSRSESNALKGFVSSQSDNYRASYGRRNQDFPRQCIFVGSTNDECYLKDATGGRRWLPIECGASIDTKGLERDVEQLWAEAVVRYRAGETWWVSGEFANLASIEQGERFVEDEWSNPISAWLFDKTKEMRRTSGVTVGEVLSQVLLLAPDKWAKADQDRVSGILRRLGWSRGPQKREDGERVRRWKPDTLASMKLVTGLVTEVVTEPVTPETYAITGEKAFAW